MPGKQAKGNNEHAGKGHHDHVRKKPGKGKLVEIMGTRGPVATLADKDMIDEQQPRSGGP